MNDIFKTFTPDQRYEEIQFRAGKGLQSRELNDMQAQLAHQIDSIGDAVFKDGDLIGGGSLVVDENAEGLGPDQVKLILNEGTVYLQGMVRVIPADELIVSSIGIIDVGVDITRETITELEDPDLRDPAVGTRNYQEPGAVRRKYTIGWEKAGDNVGEFFPIHKIDNGVLIQTAPPPQMDNVTQALARYDRESNGHYIVSGLRVTASERTNGKQVFIIEEGKAHVQGFEVELSSSLRKMYDDDPDLSEVESEPHIFSGDTDGKMRIDLNHKPLASLAKVDITRRKTVSILHGSFTGVADSLPDTAVAQIVSINQGAQAFTLGNDFVLTADAVDWSPGGSEPAPGSTYEVIYDYRTDGVVELEDETGFTVSGAVDGSLVLVDYSWKLPRLDRLAIDRDGVIWRLKGISNAFRPSLPNVPSGSLALAIIEQSWGNLPNITSDGARVTSMSELENINDRIDDLYVLTATERLLNNANLSDPSSKRGVFVDPFFDDDLRDKGAPQTAAIVNEVLMLPIAITVLDASMGSDPWTLDFDLEPVLMQPLKSTSMRINPYMAFPPVPARITLIPAIEEWTETVLVWSGFDTSRMTQARLENSSSLTQLRGRGGTALVRATSFELTFMRQRIVSFTASGFGPTELLERVTFAGIDVINRNTSPAIGEEFNADNNGVVNGSFEVPANVPAGSANVEFLGFGGSFGNTPFVSRGVVTLEERRALPPPPPRRSDPLAQTFVLQQGRLIGGVDLWFEELGSTGKPVRVQLRDVVNGVPSTRSVIAEGEIQTSEINLNQWTSVTFNPVYLEPDRDYCFIVLTDDPDHRVAIAELGKYDTQHGWITTQPYTVGVMLSSSNAVTWTPHQTVDMTFRLLGAKFIQASKTVELSDVQATQISDLLALGGVDNPSAATNITLKVVDDTGEEYPLIEGVPLALPKRLNGNLSIRAELRGNETLSPTLFPDILAILGNMADSADYISRAIPAPEIIAGDLANVRVIFESNLPGNSGVSVEVETATGWQNVSFSSGKQVGDNWEERTHLIENLDIQKTRVRLTLTGDPLNRPRVRNLQVIIT